MNGTFVIDGVVGDYLCAKYGDLREVPLTIRIEGNRLVEAHSQNAELRDEFWKYTHTDENSDRVGEFAIGTNIGLHGVIGNILQDEIKASWRSYRVRQPIRRAYWSRVDLVDAHRRGRHEVRYLGWDDRRQIMRQGSFII